MDLGFCVPFFIPSTLTYCGKLEHMLFLAIINLLLERAVCSKIKWLKAKGGKQMALLKIHFQEELEDQEGYLQRTLAHSQQVAAIEAGIDAALVANYKGGETVRYAVVELPYDTNAINTIIELKDRYVMAGWNFVLANDGTHWVVELN